MAQTIYPDEIANGENEKGEPTVDISYDEIKAKSLKGVLLVVEGEELWLPRRQIFYADTDMIEIPQWLAAKNGLA